METETNEFMLCKKCQISFHQDEIDEIGLCQKCRKNQGTVGTEKREDGTTWIAMKMRWSIIGIFYMNDAMKDATLKAKDIIQVFNRTCRRCKHESGMWNTRRCRECCFWDNPETDDEPTNFVPK